MATAASEVRHLPVPNVVMTLDLEGERQRQQIIAEGRAQELERWADEKNQITGRKPAWWVTNENGVRSFGTSPNFGEVAMNNHMDLYDMHVQMADPFHPDRVDPSTDQVLIEHFDFGREALDDEEYELDEYDEDEVWDDMENWIGENEERRVQLAQEHLIWLAGDMVRVYRGDMIEGDIDYEVEYADAIARYAAHLEAERIAAEPHQARKSRHVSKDCHVARLHGHRPRARRGAERNYRGPRWASYMPYTNRHVEDKHRMPWLGTSEGDLEKMIQHRLDEELPIPPRAIEELEAQQRELEKLFHNRIAELDRKHSAAA